jgi:hypothetical protein
MNLNHFCPPNLWTVSHALGIAPDEQLSAPLLAGCTIRRELTVIGRVVTSYADTVPTRKCEMRDNVVSIGPSAHRPHDDESREGIYARVAAASFTLVERKTRARDRSRNLEMARDLREGGLRTRGWVGGAGDPGCLGMIDVFCLVRAASENFGRPSKENLVYK